MSAFLDAVEVLVKESIAYLNNGSEELNSFAGQSKSIPCASTEAISIISKGLWQNFGGNFFFGASMVIDTMSALFTFSIESGDPSDVTGCRAPCNVPR